MAGPQAWLDGPEGGTDGRTDGRTNGRKISPFYRTSSPIGAAALPPPMKTKEKVEQGKGTADHLMPLGYLFTFSLMAGKSRTLIFSDLYQPFIKGSYLRLN